MAWVGEHWLVLTLLAGYTALMVHHARVGHRATKNVADYYVGGRAMGGVVLGISFFATYSSTNSFIGFSGQAYTYGAPWLLLTVCAVVFSAAAWIWIAPRLRAVTASLNSVTLPDYIGFRFGSTPARVAAAVIVLFASFLYMTAVFKGIGNLLETFLDVPYAVAIGLVFIIVVIYTAVGGFISVVKTDAVQGIVMAIAAVLLFAGTVRAAGGLGAVEVVRANPETTSLFRWDAAMPFPVILGIMVAGTMKFLVEPRQLSRFYALADAKAIRHGMWVSTFVFLGVYALLMPIGLYAHAILPERVAESDLVVPTLLSMGSVFSPALASLLVVAMVAAAMSSLDSVLLVMASTCARDLLGVWRNFDSDHTMMRTTRRLVAIFALVTALLALRPPGPIVTMTAFSGSLYAACFLPAIMFGLFRPGGNGAAVLASFATGIGTLLLWHKTPWGGAVHEVFPAMALSLAAYAVGARIRPAHEAPEVDALFPADRSVAQPAA